MKFYHLGSIGQFTCHKDNPNSYRTMLHTSGDNRLFVAEFGNEARSSECNREFGTIKNCAADINQDNGEVLFPLKRRPSVFGQCGSHLLMGTFLTGACTWSCWTFVVPLRMSVLVMACLLFYDRLFFIATTMWVQMSLSPTMLTSSAWCWKTNVYIILHDKAP